MASCAILLAGPVLADTDTLEDLPEDGTPIHQRVIDGVTVSISNENGDPLFAATYDDCTPAIFGGVDGACNVPLNRSQVSGRRFIGRCDPPALVTLFFELDPPATAFGLTTLDLLETSSDPDDHDDMVLSLVAYDVDGIMVDIHIRQGPQDASGLDLDWFVQSDTGDISWVELTGFVGSGFCFGIDDIIVNATGCPADLDGDGDADADDFFAYLDGFASGDLDACDLDGDADCDADDFFDYLDLFAVGC